jgi:uncharacterized damage-inducible protein DinB
VTDRTYCRTMSRYNAVQNKALWSFLQQMDEADLTADYGSPQRSVLGTLNHLLWLDQMWLSRLFKVKPPEAPQDKTATLTPTSAAWWAERFCADAALRMWADMLASFDLHGDLAFVSLTGQNDVIAPQAVCVMRMFNQQTDLRVQVRFVLIGMGQDLPPTALFLMPRD